MEHELKTVLQTITPITMVDEFHTGPAAWLVKQAQNHNLRWLLVHADDGVIWGDVRESGLHLSSNAFPKVSPPLRSITIQQVRLFGEDGELLLWRTDNGFAARLLLDGQGTKMVECFEEPYLLWGTYVEEAKDGFSKLCQGAQGLRHTPPVHMRATDDGKLQDRVAVMVRHYLAYDEDGQAYVNTSRLVRAFQKKGGRNEPQA